LDELVHIAQLKHFPDLEELVHISFMHKVHISVEMVSEDYCFQMVSETCRANLFFFRNTSCYLPENWNLELIGFLSLIVLVCSSNVQRFFLDANGDATDMIEVDCHTLLPCLALFPEGRLMLGR
jgi:hypothetical protein